MTNYTVDQTWVQPFTPVFKEPSVLSTSPLILKPREDISHKTKIFTFEFPTISEYVVDLKTVQLSIRGQLLHNNLSLLEKEEDVYLSNAPLYSLFSSVNLVFGENQAKIVYNDYPHLALFQMLDKMTDNNRRIIMTGFIPDDGSEDRNTIRKLFVSESRECVLMGKVLTDILDIDSFLLKNTPLTIQFEKSDADFYVCSSDDENEYKFVIKDIELHVQTIKPNPQLTEAIESHIKSNDAIYNFDHLILKKFHIPDNVFNYNINRLWTGKLPRRFAFSTISQDTYQGVMYDDPMKLSLANIKKIKLKVNQKDLETIELENLSYLCYSKMLDFLQAGEHSFVTKGLFDKSLTFICFDLNMLCDNNSACVNELSPSGTLSMEISFKKNNDTPLILFMYAFNAAQLTIDNKRHCTIITNHS